MHRFTKRTIIATRRQQRRTFLTQALAVSTLSAVPGLLVHAAENLLVTPRQTRGPFYPREFPLDSDNDLTQVKGYAAQAAGQVTDIVGQVLDDRGRPVSRALVEIWQCDANGRYHHPGDRSTSRPLDPGFQGYGTFTTADDGTYRFRTIRPVRYPGRTPHIHFSVAGPGFEPIATQMYVKGEPGNQGDGVYRGIRDARLRDSVTVELQKNPAAPETLAGSFDIVLAADGRY